MIDVLLINTPISRIKRDPNSGECVPPIGLGYIYTQLSQSGFKCQFIDAVLHGQLPKEVLEIINRSEALHIGLNVFSSNVDIVRNLVENGNSHRNFFLGGPAIHALVPEIKRWKPFGSLTVVMGDAELMLPELIRKSAQHTEHDCEPNFIDIAPGSAFYPMNIDLPLDRSIFENEPICRDDLGLIESHIITSRGCIYNCAYCTAATSCNPATKPRYRTYESMFEEIETIRKSSPETNCIRILDDLFLRNPASVELAKNLFPRNKVFWRSMAHINTFRNLPAESLSDIKKSGCRELFIGIESGNDEILKHIRKPFSSETAYKTVCRILDAYVPVKCYFILGFPGETKSAVQDTVSLASHLKEYADQINVQLRISPFRFRPYHGTTLYNELVKKGWTIAQIQNRNDILDTKDFNPYDCISGCYSDYDDKFLDKCMYEMEKLNPDHGSAAKQLNKAS